MKPFAIRSFTGIETKFDAEDQDRGTLHVAQSVMIAPQGMLSGGPTWATAWGYSTLATSLATALTGANSAKVHFVVVQDAFLNRLLIAWDLSTTSCRGAWFVRNGSSAPNFSSASGVSITATTGSVYRDKTGALPWYGTWLGNRLYLGNGTDPNLVWDTVAASLGLLTASDAAAADPSQNTIPPCTCFAQGPDGVIYAAGNVTNPLYVYATEPPTYTYPTPTGLLTSDRSFVSIKRYAPSGTRVTALSPVNGGVMAHLSSGGAVWIGRPDQSRDGNLMEQRPLTNITGAPNQACVCYREAGVSYLGADLELYFAKARRAEGYGQKEPRDNQIETWKSSGQWNRLMYRGALAGYQPYVIDDLPNNRLWISAPLALRQIPGLYCFDRKSNGITGPFHYPCMSAIAPLMRQDLPGATQPEGNGAPFVVVGVSISGSLMYADLGKVGELPRDAYGTALGSGATVSETQTTPTTGLTAIGVYNSGQSFARVDSDGRVDVLTTPWSDWASNGTTVPDGITSWYNNAHVSIIEIRDEDFGDPDVIKEFLQTRLQFLRNTRAYVGIYGESEGRFSGKWRGGFYPREEVIGGMTLSGRRLTVRIIIVTFAAQTFTLHGLTHEIEPAVAT